jgi:hypothetical protein
MNKGPEFPKVSFLVARQTLNKLDAMAKAEGMTLSETMRLVLEAGLEKLAEKPAPASPDFMRIEEERAMFDAGVVPARYEQAPAQPRGIGATRGKFPRPTGGDNGDPSK